MRLACLVALTLACASPAWALLPCPAAARDVPLTGSLTGSFYGGSPQTHSLQMHPCEEFWVDVQASSGDPNLNANLYLDVRNPPPHNTSIAFKSWPLNYWSTPSVSEANALPVASVGFPLAGTRDSRSLVARIDVWSDYARPWGQIAYTLTVHFRPRPGYNLGGQTFTDAFGPLANGTVLHASMWPNEVDYYRVSMQAGGTLTLSGSLTNENWSLGAPILIRVFNMAQQAQATLLSQSVPANSSHDPNGAAVTFTSPTFTNNTGQTQDFYIVVENANFARLQDSTINIAGTSLVPPPQLTLFLDADNNFSTGSPNSDHLSYLPGKDPSSNASISPASLPQTVKLIAAYVNGSNQIVAPPAWAPTITFSLADTSRFVGVAMNSGNQTDDDFQLVATTADFSTLNDNTARVSLNCNDYGGFTTATATDGASAPGFRLPDDGATQNWLPSAGWYTSTGSGVDQGAAGDDSDSTPTASGAAGDGLSAFEEFRGFIVMGDHVRTNPAFKDIFVYSQFTVEGLGNAWTLPVAPHQIGEDELDGFRRIAPNYQNSGSGGNIPGHFVGTRINGSTSEQLAIVVFDDQIETDIPASGDIVYGSTNAQLNQSGVAVVGPPWTVGSLAARVFTIRVRKASPTSDSPSTTDNFDSAKLDQTIAHEIGHNLTIDHVDWNQACPPYADTVMVTNYFLKTSNGNDCAWNHIPYLYSLVDIGNLRVR